MLKKIRTAFVLSLFATTPVFANAVITSAANFTEVQQMIAQAPHPHHTLLALDDDDTLTMMPCPVATQCQHLGGPEWFTWQAELPIGDTNRIWTTFPQLLAINAMLFGISEMPLDDSAIPAALAAADNRNMKIMVITARGYITASSTERQLSDDNILPLIEKDALKTRRGHIGFAGEYLPTPWNNTKPVRLVAYNNGIFYVSGQNKGVMLEQILKKTHKTKHISEIIFVDDMNQNVIDVANAYKNNPDINVISVHYMGTHADKQAFLTGPNAKKLQAIANSQWVAIAANLRQQLPGFNL